MKKPILLVFVLILFSMSMLGTGLMITVSGSTTHHVYSGESIQDAVDSAQSGDTIIVHNGTYYEQVVVNKSLTLTGENEDTIIDGERKDLHHLVCITADNVNFSGFTIQNFSVSWVSWFAGSMVIDSSRGCNITGNIFVDNYQFSILLDNSSYNVLSNNFIRNGTGGIMLSYESSNNTVSKNTLTSMGYDGIKLVESSNDNVITNNHIAENDPTKTTGVPIYSSHYNWVTENNITGNRYGIRLYFSSNNSISGNNITNNDYGIWHEDSSHYNNISGNNIMNNNYGIRLEDSSNNSVYHNNFVNNTYQVYSENSVNVWDDGYPSGGNYWSDHTDVDQYSGPNQDQPDSDEIWDHPYFIDENNQDNYPIVPEFPTWTSTLLILILLTVATAIYKQGLLKMPIH